MIITPPIAALIGQMIGSFLVICAVKWGPPGVIGGMLLGALALAVYSLSSL